MTDPTPVIAENSKTARPGKDDAIFGTTAVITGAAAGVGRAVAMAFARRGARLGLIARDKDALEEFSSEIAAIGAATSLAPIDVADAAAVAEAARRFERELGPIDIWVNDAMVTVFSPIADITPEEFRRVTEVTYLGVVHGAMAALRPMRKRGRGHIIIIGSALAYRGIPLQAAYCGAKHAIRGFAASLRSELSHDKSNIAVSLIELPAMNTPQFDWARTHIPRMPKPMGTIYQPEVAAEAVCRAARKRPREYWVGASTFFTIVGNMVLPDFMDWYLGQSAVSGQQTSEPVPPGRRDNLFQSLTSLHRIRGSFNAAARTSGIILSGSLARIAVVGVGALIFFILGGLLL